MSLVTFLSFAFSSARLSSPILSSSLLSSPLLISSSSPLSDLNHDPRAQCCLSGLNLDNPSPSSLWPPPPSTPTQCSLSNLRRNHPRTMPNRMPQSIPHRMHNHMPDRLSEYMSPYMSATMPNTMPDEMPSKHFSHNSPYDVNIMFPALLHFQQAIHSSFLQSLLSFPRARSIPFISRTLTSGFFLQPAQSISPRNSFISLQLFFLNLFLNYPLRKHPKSTLTHFAFVSTTLVTFSSRS